MNVEVDFDELKEIIIFFLKLRNGLGDGVPLDWAIDFNANLNDEFLKDVKRLQGAMLLFKASLGSNDLITAQCALIRARAVSMDLSNFFGNIAEDIERIAWTGGFDWPEIPEGYKIPERYNFSDER
jgi:hypothetical protein